MHSLTVSVQPPCAIACINICAHVKNPKHWQPYHCLDERKYYTHVHWQEWVALLLWLLEPYPSKTATRISRKGQRSTQTKQKIIFKIKKKRILLDIVQWCWLWFGQTQALVYDILPWRKVSERDAQRVWFGLTKNVILTLSGLRVNLAMFLLLLCVCVLCQ